MVAFLYSMSKIEMLREDFQNVKEWCFLFQTKSLQRRKRSNNSSKKKTSMKEKWIAILNKTTWTEWWITKSLKIKFRNLRNQEEISKFKTRINMIGSTKTREKWKIKKKKKSNSCKKHSRSNWKKKGTCTLNKCLLTQLNSKKNRLSERKW